MKARTHFLNGDNHYEVYFAYEDYYGGEKFGTYDEMLKNGELPNNETECGYLVGYLHSFYWGCTERIDMLELKGKPTISQVKKFMESCYNCLKTDGLGHKKEDKRMSRYNKEDAEYYYLSGSFSLAR